MKLLIVGSRNIEKFNLSEYISPQTDLIISGGAKGLDSLAEKYADEILSIRTFYEAHYIKKGLPITYMAFRISNPGQLISPTWEEDHWYEEEIASHGFVPANKG